MKMFDAVKGDAPADMASAVNLFAHPVAAAAAASALGIGFASHAFGLWMGVASAAAEAIERANASWLDAISGDGMAGSPAFGAKSVARAPIADARSTAQVISLAGKRGGGKRKP